MNRISDVLFILGILSVLSYFKTTCLNFIFNLSYYIKNESINFFNFFVNINSFICFFLFIGAVGKSAQLGLHT